MSPIDPRRHLMHLRHPRHCFRCRERASGRLQLRVALTPDEGVCEVVVAETDNRVEVLILVCGEIEDRGQAVDCPVHVYLARALGGREVVDATRDGAPVERFTLNW